MLLGADGMLRTRRINLLYIEWSGDPGVVRALGHHEYRIYDSIYIGFPRIHDVKPFEKMGFEFIDEVKLSTGKVAYELLLTSKELSPSDAVKMVRESNLGYVQTDLIAVSESTLGRFLEAAERYGEAKRSRTAPTVVESHRIAAQDLGQALQECVARLHAIGVGQGQLGARPSPLIVDDHRAQAPG